MSFLKKRIKHRDDDYDDDDDEDYEDYDDYDDDYEDYDEDEDDEDEDDEDEDDEDEDDEDDSDTSKITHASTGNTKAIKYGLGAVVILAIAAVGLVAIVLVKGVPSTDLASHGPSKQNSSPSGVISANDTGPVSVIMDDPTCASWTTISNSFANTLNHLGNGAWNDRDRTIPASAWTPEQKAQYIAGGQVLRGAATQTLGLIKLTPHRVMRELYEQFVAYSRTFVDHIPQYTAQDANLDQTAHSAASALAAICASVNNGSAGARGPLVPAIPAPQQVAPVGNPSNPSRFLVKPNSVCTDWKTTLNKFGTDTAEWQKLNPNIPALLWNKQQRAINLAAGQAMNSYAGKLVSLGNRSHNPILKDLADLSAQYCKAFTGSLPTYNPADNTLANAATYLATTILGGCDSAAIS